MTWRRNTNIGRKNNLVLLTRQHDGCVSAHRRELQVEERYPQCLFKLNCFGLSSHTWVSLALFMFKREAVCSHLSMQQWNAVWKLYVWAKPINYRLPRWVIRQISWDPQVSVSLSQSGSLEYKPLKQVLIWDFHMWPTAFWKLETERQLGVSHLGMQALS